MGVLISRGNLVKLLQVPLVGLGSIASLIVPRSADRWVFGCGSGVGEGSLALQRVAAAAGRTTVWIARDERDERDAADLGIETVRRGTFASFWQTLRAGVVVITHGFGDVSRFGVHGAYVVNLWHGIPLKHLHRDAPGFLRLPGIPDVGPVRRLLSAAHARSARRISLFPVAGEREASRIRSAFGLDETRVAVLGAPRVDRLRGGGLEASAARASALIAATGIADAATTMLYAPTWRDGQVDPAVPSADEWRAIAAWLEAHDARLVVRSHPHGAGDYRAGPTSSSRIVLCGVDLLADATELLAGVDVLVTDYSSIAYDFSLIGRPTLFLAPDVAAYEAMRGLYDSFGEFSGGHVETWDALLEWAGRLDDPQVRGERERHARRLVRETQQLPGGATERVHAAISGAMGIQTPAVPTGAAPVAGVPVAAVTAPDMSIGERLPPAPIVRQVWRDGMTLRVRGTTASAPHIVAARLRGRRSVVPGSVVAAGRADGGSADAGSPQPGSAGPVSAGRGSAEPGSAAEVVFDASVPLVASQWGAPAAALASGSWLLELVDAEGVRVQLAVEARLPGSELTEDARLAYGMREGSISVEVSPPLADDELGSAAQRALEERWLTSPTPERAVFFESFYGSSVSDNPLAIDRALARLRPDVTRYWSTRDASVPIPDGAVRVVEGTTAWWKARGSARVLVVNDWLRKRVRPQTHQSVLQTWHGTPLKRLALQRDGVGLRTRIASRREGRRWSILLAQNEHAEQSMRAAYDFTGTVWQLGYPRSDTLVRGDAAEVRARLGVPQGDAVVLYAPTWRDDRAGVVDHAGVGELARLLGPGHTVVVRGHSRTLDAAHELLADGVIDASTYPDAAELLLAADVLVTDYSSVMFDFAATGRPIVFAVPDLDDYRDRLRGFTFDFAARAPGPLTSTPAETAARILARDDEREEWAGRMRRWQDDFVPRDDGMAGERVVERMVDTGMLQPVRQRAGQ